ncbi:MAG TPA: ATP-binding protein [Polyangiaceae bacterium]
MHKLLERQIRKLFGDDVPNDLRLQRLLAMVDQAYQAADADRALLERSVELASSELLERNVQLESDLAAIQRLEIELGHAEKLRAVGQLASGIAHEINTPIQFANDSVHFLKGAVVDIFSLLEAARMLADSVEAGGDGRAELASYRSKAQEVDLAYLDEECPKAFEQAQEGLMRVAQIVMAMKEFGRPDQREKVLIDVNRCVTSTLTVAHNELKYAADIRLELAELTPVPCYPGELSQVLLNLLVNAAHAIADRHAAAGRMGKIVVRTKQESDSVLVSISDDGAGISEEHRQRVFEPFFTTKAVGRGTGQGLAISRSIVVDKHGGTLTFETELGVGTTFFLRLPSVEERATASERTLPRSSPAASRAGEQP